VEKLAFRICEHKGIREEGKQRAKIRNDEISRDTNERSEEYRKVYQSREAISSALTYLLFCEAGARVK